MELNRENIIKALECCIGGQEDEDCTVCPYDKRKHNCVICLMNDALTLIKLLTEENESLGIENEVQKLNLGNTRDDLNNAECDVARLKRENTALEREVERLKKADVVPRSEYDNLKMQFTALDIECDRLEKVEENFHKAKTDVAREIFEKIEKIINQPFAVGFDLLSPLKQALGDYNNGIRKDLLYYIAELKKKYIGE